MNCDVWKEEMNIKSKRKAQTEKWLHSLTHGPLSSRRSIWPKDFLSDNIKVFRFREKMVWMDGPTAVWA
jgi:hypothetical protein